MALDLTTAEETISVLLADDDELPFEVNEAAGTTPSTSMSGVTFTLYILRDQLSGAANAAALAAAALVTKANATVTNRDDTAWTGAFPLAPGDKAPLSVGTYYYRLHMVESGGQDTTIMRGPFVVAG
jgi:hypothetical protein